MTMNESMADFYPMPPELADMAPALQAIRSEARRFETDADALKTIFNCIDLTTLSPTDSATSVCEFVERVNRFAADHPDLGNVGGICVHSVFAPVLKKTLRVPGVRRAVVSAGFPSSQTFTDVKCLETQRAVEFGADEVDVVMAVGEFLDGNYEFVGTELARVKAAAGNARLKVILETGALRDAEDVWNASLLAIASGADIIKTSTGKGIPGASHEAAFVMCHAIAAYARNTGRKIGFKPAGGIATVEDAAVYYNIVRTVCGPEWLCSSLFRVGASRLANTLVSAIRSLQSGTEQTIKYF